MRQDDRYTAGIYLSPKTESRLRACYEQGNRVESTAWKLSMREVDVAVWYAHYSILQARQELRRTAVQTAIMEP